MGCVAGSVGETGCVAVVEGEGEGLGCGEGCEEEGDEEPGWVVHSWGICRWWGWG